MIKLKLTAVILLVCMAATLYYCSPGKEKKVKVEAKVIDICNPSSGFYKFPEGLGLPSRDSIPGHNNIDSISAFLQNVADSFSWLSFISLNWPANSDGTPDSTKRLGTSSGYSVFESWMPSTGIYHKNNLPPRAWGDIGHYSNNPLDSSNEPRTIAEIKRFGIKSAEQEHLIDQNGNFTLFQVVYNKPAYNYVVNGNLYNLKGQKEFAKNWPSNTSGMVVVRNGKQINIEQTYQRAYFPVGCDVDTIIPAGGDVYHFSLNLGAAIVKTAWRQMTDKDDVSRYYVREIERQGEHVKLALVGMHIIHKVAETTQWVWSTFEHIDNAPQLGSDSNAIVEEGVKYSYFDPTNKDRSLYNKPSDKGVTDPKAPRKPTQVVRILKVQDGTEKMNACFIKLLKQSDPKSVWQYYKLIGTQWPLNPMELSMGFQYTPPKLANTTLETFNQGNSDCMGCHASSRFLGGDSVMMGKGYNADFIWGLANAK